MANLTPHRGGREFVPTNQGVYYGNTQLPMGFPGSMRGTYMHEDPFMGLPMSTLDGQAWGQMDIGLGLTASTGWNGPGQWSTLRQLDAGPAPNMLSQARCRSSVPNMNMNMMRQTTFPGSEYHRNPIFQNPTCGSQLSGATVPFYPGDEWTGLFLPQPEYTGQAGPVDVQYSDFLLPTMDTSLGRNVPPPLVEASLPASGQIPTFIPQQAYEQSASAQMPLLFSSSPNHPHGQTVDEPEPHGAEDQTQLAAQPGQATLHDEETSADSTRDGSSHTPSARRAIRNNDGNNISRSQSPPASPSIPRIHVSQQQAEEISRIIDEGLRQAFRGGLLRANAHINKSLQLELERHETIAWNKVLASEGQDNETKQKNVEMMKRKIEGRMRQCYEEVLKRLLTDELLEQTRKHFRDELCKLGFGNQPR
ncbi:hypothetical protein E4U55_004449 [Claviceps digitariae]|nr:hypothetical protein E4U55_004449 [Claviceps digitariae]